MSPAAILAPVLHVLRQNAEVATAVADTPPDIMATLTSVLGATVTSIAATAAATATESAGPDHGPGVAVTDDGECRLLGPFAIIIQMALGGLALLSLVYKRWRERPQRPVKIWFFDVSKQVVGSILVHIANVFMSMLTSGRFSVKVDPSTVQTAARLLRRGEDEYIPNPCSFYLLNLAIDTTIGIPILLLLLKVTTGLVSHTPLGKPAASIQSGNYGNPPNAWWWLKQSFIYFCGLFGMKVCVLVIFLVLPWIARVGDWALGWTEGNEHLQIVFVMMLFPLIMNALQYYIIDSFIKKEVDHEPLPTEEHDPFGDALLDSEDEDDDGSTSDDSTNSMKMSKSSFQRQSSDSRVAGQDREEYDPDIDGQTIVGSSRSQDTRGKLLPKELVPPE